MTLSAFWSRRTREPALSISIFPKITVRTSSVSGGASRKSRNACGRRRRYHHQILSGQESRRINPRRAGEDAPLLARGAVSLHGRHLYGILPSNAPLAHGIDGHRAGGAGGSDHQETSGLAAL